MVVTNAVTSKNASCPNPRFGGRTRVPRKVPALVLVCLVAKGGLVPVNVNILPKQRQGVRISVKNA